MQSKQGQGRGAARRFFGGLALMAQPHRWRGQHVWWMQILATAVLAVTVVSVWQLAGGDLVALRGPGGQSGPAGAALVAAAGAILVALLAEAAARVMTRAQERRRFAERFGIDPVGPAPRIPDGYVLAYELGNQPGQLGAQFGDPFLVVAAIRADRWDISEPLWRFTVRESAVAGGGVVVQVPTGSFAAVDQVRWLWAELDAGRLLNLVAVEAFLVDRFARDVSSVYFQPPAG